jgi:hypothetical protein
MAQMAQMTGITQMGDSRSRLWTSYGLSGIAVLFLLFDSVIKVLQIGPVETSLTELGYPVTLAFRLGVIELLCLALYVWPQTSVLGAILLTGFLGGAVATHVRIGSPLASHTLFPLYVAALVWGGLFLRERRLHALVPWRR